MALAQLFRELFTEMKPKHFQILRKELSNMDTTNSGKLMFLELKAGMIEFIRKNKDLEQANLRKEELFSGDLKQIDDKSEILYDDLINVATNDYIIDRDENLYSTLRELDKDDDGLISTKELKAHFAQSETYGRVKDIEKIIEESKLDDNGKIDYELFLKTLHPSYDNKPKWFHLGLNDHDTNDNTAQEQQMDNVMICSHKTSKDNDTSNTSVEANSNGDVPLNMNGNIVNNDVIAAKSSAFDDLNQNGNVNGNMQEIQASLIPITFLDLPLFKDLNIDSTHIENDSMQSTISKNQSESDININKVCNGSSIVSPVMNSNDSINSIANEANNKNSTNNNSTNEDGISSTIAINSSRITNNNNSSNNDNLSITNVSINSNNNSRNEGSISTTTNSPDTSVSSSIAINYLIKKSDDISCYKRSAFVSQIFDLSIAHVERYKQWEIQILNKHFSFSKIVSNLNQTMTRSPDTQVIHINNVNRLQRLQSDTEITIVFQLIKRISIGKENINLKVNNETFELKPLEIFLIHNKEKDRQICLQTQSNDNVSIAVVQL